MRVSSVVVACCLTFVTLQLPGAAADAAALSVAQGQPGQAQPGQEEFVPIKELPPEDRLPAAPLLIAAYVFVWIALVGYIWSVWRRLGKVERELADVTRRAAARQAGKT